MKKDNSIEKNIISFLNYLWGPLFSALLSFLIVPLITRLISPDQLGKASMYELSISLISMIIFLGLDQALLREGKRKENFNSIFSSAFFPSLFLSISISVIILIFSKNISFLLLNEYNFLFVLLISVLMPVLVINRFSQVILRLEDKGKRFSISMVFKKITYLMILSFLLLISRDYTIVIFAIFLSWFFQTVFLFTSTRKEWKMLEKFNYTKFISMLKFGFPVLVGSIIYYLLQTTDRFSLRYLSDFQQIGIYSACLRITAVLTLIRSAFTTFWIPKSYQIYDENKNTEIFDKIAKIIFCITGFLYILIVMFKDFIILILGAEYREAVILLPWLLLIPISNVLSDIFGIGITGTKKTSWNIFVVVIAAVFNLLGNILLVPDLGALGASISSGLSFLLFLWIKIIISKRLGIKISISRLLFNTLILIFICIESLVIKNFFLLESLLTINALLFIFINKNEFLISIRKSVYYFKKIFRKRRKNTDKASTE